MGIADKYELISKMGYILSVFFLIVTILLYFLFNIRKIICDLSGITEKHAISRIRAANAAQIDSDIGITAKAGYVSITDKIAGIGVSWEKKQDLNNNETMLLENAYEETTLLQQTGITEELDEVNVGNRDCSVSYHEPLKNQFLILESIVIVHSDVIIHI
ncbi:MAG: hypothetical protein HFI34_07685 [Lachnospiraceae bacterium]|nr:hypothetical protein [Lachnospiraceae bacterium]